MFIKMNGKQQSSMSNITKIKQSKSTLLNKIDLTSPTAKINKSYVDLEKEKKKYSSRESSMEKSIDSKG